MNNNHNKIISALGYIFILFFLAFLFYKYYATIFINGENNKSNPPNNSINVSPITGEVIQNVTSNAPLLQVTYDYNDISRLYKITSADIVIEEFLSESGSLIYKGIFYNKNISLNESISTISSISTNSLPTIKFLDPLELDKNLFSNKIDTIFISYTPQLNTSFIYKNGEYFHYSTNVQDVNRFSNTPITFKNVLVEFGDKSGDTHDGMLFSGGKLQKLKISGTKITMINDSKELPFSLLRGNTIWVKCPNSSKIITADSHIES
ncbi:hypothetical protein [Clostridium sp. YIM B02551]|uniref:hypothetical protein n=1 Tax=Clostridium sp. YIM B02551 TaxID=2910679 RepID=UPI001EEA6F8A|nr:hypothetical protein [Clostridium sp. YIM B02551]